MDKIDNRTCERVFDKNVENSPNAEVGAPEGSKVGTVASALARLRNWEMGLRGLSSIDYLEDVSEFICGVANQIEAAHRFELDELQFWLDRSMILPRDANGEPIHVCDELVEDGMPFVVRAVGMGEVVDECGEIYKAENAAHSVIPTDPGKAGVASVEASIREQVRHETNSDPVNHPSHYTAGRFETIDVIEDSMTPEAFRGYCMGNVLKYLIRHEHKGGVEDLRKGAWYLNRLIASEDGDAS